MKRATRKLLMQLIRRGQVSISGELTIFTASDGNPLAIVFRASKGNHSSLKTAIPHKKRTHRS